MERRQRTCRQCGVGFIEKSRSARQIAAGAKQLFCSKACAGDARRKYATTREAKAAYRLRAKADRAPRHVACSECGQESSKVTCSAACATLRANRRARERYAVEQPLRAFACAECGRAVTPPLGNTRRAYCSEVCAKRSGKRANRKAERARRRSQQVEPVNPTKVFDRDGWKCQLCGKSTPRKLRGKNLPNSPELDHIVPLAAGGEHSYRNTQCACRACNGVKAANPLGQLRLFG